VSAFSDWNEAPWTVEAFLRPFRDAWEWARGLHDDWFLASVTPGATELEKKTLARIATPLEEMRRATAALTVGERKLLPAVAVGRREAVNRIASEGGPRRFESAGLNSGESLRVLVAWRKHLLMVRVPCEDFPPLRFSCEFEVARLVEGGCWGGDRTVGFSVRYDTDEGDSAQPETIEAWRAAGEALAAAGSRYAPGLQALCDSSPDHLAVYADVVPWEFKGEGWTPGLQRGEEWRMTMKADAAGPSQLTNPRETS
jgi:hypothetical protein